MDSKLIRFIKRLQLWLFISGLAERLLLLLPIGLAAAAAEELAACFLPWYHVNQWAAGSILLAAFLAFLWALFRFPKRKEAAARLDATGLQERTSTAVELLGRDDFFARLQKKDAWKYLENMKIAKRLPLHFGWKRPAMILLCLLLAGICTYIPSDAKNLAEEKHQLAEQVKEEETRVKEAEKELEKMQDLSAEETADYKALLEEIREELQEASSQEDLEKALERGEMKLGDAAEKTENAELKDAMQKLADNISQGQENSGSNLQLAKEQLQAAEDLQKLLDQAQKSLDENGELSGLTGEEQENLENALNKLQENTGLSQEQLQNLQNLSDALDSGSVSSSQLADAAAAAQAASASASAQIAKASSQNSSSNGSNGQRSTENGTENQENGSGKGSDSSQNGSSGGNTGNSSGNGSGSGDGSGTGSGDGSGSGSGSGSGNGSGSGSGNGAGSGNGTGGGWNYGSSQGTQKDEEYNGDMVSIPNETGDDGNLTGSSSDGDTYSVSGGDALTWSGNQVTYDQVLGTYTEKALAQIQNSNYPTGMQEIIKKYFNDIK